jgi:hypothetical protein
MPLDGQDIHSAWCTCSDCCLDSRRSLRLDLLVLALGAGAALLAIAALVAAPFIDRFFTGWGF